MKWYQEWCYYMSVIPAVWKEAGEFKASLNYVARPVSKTIMK
jgi:hypothetical protein